MTGAPPGGDVTAAYCPVCSPVYAGTQYQRYAAPLGLNNSYYRRPDLDVFRTTHGGTTHGPDLLGDPATSGAPVTCSAAALRAVSCSAPDLIELSSRLPVDQERQQDADDKQVRCVTSFPARHVSQSTVVFYEQSPSSRRRRTINDEH